jgi:hypothetical protein
MVDSNFLFDKIVNGNANHSYQAIQLMKLDTIAFYDKFLNWIKEEFDLYLMNESLSESLLVYFPNGCFSVKNISKTEPFVIVEVKIVSKTLDCGTKTANQITAVINLFHKALDNHKK